MSSRAETEIAEFSGWNDDSARDVRGRVVDPTEVIGTRLKMATRHPVQIFFIGVGEDADMQVGRILAEATGAEFQGVMEEDLAEVLGEFSKYF